MDAEACRPLQDVVLAHCSLDNQATILKAYKAVYSAAAGVDGLFQLLPVPSDIQRKAKVFAKKELQFALKGTCTWLTLLRMHQCARVGTCSYLDADGMFGNLDHHLRHSQDGMMDTPAFAMYVITVVGHWKDSKVVGDQRACDACLITIANAAKISGCLHTYYGFPYQTLMVLLKSGAIGPMVYTLASPHDDLQPHGGVIHRLSRTWARVALATMLAGPTELSDDDVAIISATGAIRLLVVELLNADFQIEEHNDVPHVLDSYVEYIEHFDNLEMTLRALGNMTQYGKLRDQAVQAGAVETLSRLFEECSSHYAKYDAIQIVANITDSQIYRASIVEADIVESLFNFLPRPAGTRANLFEVTVPELVSRRQVKDDFTRLETSSTSSSVAEWMMCEEICFAFNDDHKEHAACVLHNLTHSERLRDRVVEAGAIEFLTCLLDSEMTHMPQSVYSAQALANIAQSEKHWAAMIGSGAVQALQGFLVASFVCIAQHHADPSLKPDYCAAAWAARVAFVMECQSEHVWPFIAGAVERLTGTSGGRYSLQHFTEMRWPEALLLDQL